MGYSGPLGSTCLLDGMKPLIQYDMIKGEAY